MIKGKLRISGDYLAFYCPGCKAYHYLSLTGRPAWQFSGDYESPTFSPSVLVRSGHYLPGHTGPCWCTTEDWKPEDFKCMVCHSFVENGQIRYLEDCTHALAGQTVPLTLKSEDDENSTP